MDIGSMLQEELVFTNKNFATSTEVLEFVNEEATKLGKVESGFLEAITQREEEFPTGLQLENYGVAIPHTDPEHITEEFIAVVTLAEPAEFKPMDGSPEPVMTDLVFVLGLKDPEGQLATLQNIMQVIQDEETIQTILETDDRQTIINAF